MATRPPRTLLLCAFAAFGATCKGNSQPPAPPPPALAPDSVPDSGATTAASAATAPRITSIPNFDIAAVPPPARDAFWRLLNRTFPYCGCERTVASCLAHRDVCSCVNAAELTLKFIVGELARGMSAEEVEFQLLEGFTEGYAGKQYTFDLAGHPSRGPEQPEHTIVEFADFRCGHCKAAKPVIDALLAKHPNLRFVYFYYPLGGPGSEPMLAAEAAEEARVQGKFWAMADALFTNQHDLSKDKLLAYGAQAGLDVARLRKALDNHTHRDRVLADKNMGHSAGVESTPAFYIDGRRFGLDRNLDNFELRLTMEKHRGRCD